MASKLHKNAILTGYVDCYCLPCQSRIKSFQEAHNHIEKPIHRKNLELCPYLENYCNHYIRKVTAGYYCEYCNDILPTLMKVNLHVKENKHLKCKGNDIQRFNNDVIMNNKILIQFETWNGIITSANVTVCAICNVEIDDVSIHVTKDEHVLNLVKMELEFADGLLVYRKVDDTSFHCLICNKICEMSLIGIHAKHPTHEMNFELALQLFDKIKDFVTTDKPIDKLNNTNDNQNEYEMLIKVSKELKAPNQDNVDKNEAINKDDLNDVSKKIESKIVKDGNDVDLNSIENDRVAFAKEHKLTYNKGNNNAYCRVCATRVPASLTNLREHVFGNSHKTKVARISQSVNRTESKSIPVPQKIAMARFVERVDTCVVGFLPFYIEEFSVVNRKYCMSKWSFYMITNQDRLRCQICEVNLEETMIESHVKTSIHELKMALSPVVWNLKNEFFREIRSGIFHCSFCNLIVGQWKTVFEHIECEEHKERRKFAECRLERSRNSTNVTTVNSGRTFGELW